MIVLYIVHMYVKADCDALIDEVDKAKMMTDEVVRWSACFPTNGFSFSAFVQT